MNRSDAIKGERSERSWGPETDKALDKIVKEEFRLEKELRELVDKKRETIRNDLNRKRRRSRSQI